MALSDKKRILYLDGQTVEQFLPSQAEALDLVEAALIAISQGDAALGHSVLRTPAGTGFSAITGLVQLPMGALAGQKWVGEAPASAGVTALMMMNDFVTGEVHTLMDARLLTGLRTAAVSGVCIRALGAPGPVVIVGTGLQCLTHLSVLESLGRTDVRIVYRRQSSADRVARWARTSAPGLRPTFTDDLEAAVRGAAIVLTMVSRGVTTARIEPDWLADDCLVLPVDFAHCIGADVAAGAVLIASDDPANYRHAVGHGDLPGYPADVMATGRAIREPRPGGRVVIQNLGNAAGDLMIANQVRQAAMKAAAGQHLNR